MDASVQRLHRLWERNYSEIEVGAVISRKTRKWTIVRQETVATGIWLTLRSGRRKFRLYVSVCITGPHLFGTGFKQVAPAPYQKSLFSGAAS